MQADKSGRKRTRRRFLIGAAVVYSLVVAPVSALLYLEYVFCYDCTEAQTSLSAVLMAINLPLFVLGTLVGGEPVLLVVLCPLAGAIWGWVLWLVWSLVAYIHRAKRGERPSRLT